MIGFLLKARTSVQTGMTHIIDAVKYPLLLTGTLWKGSSRISNSFGNARRFCAYISEGQKIHVPIFIGKGATSVASNHQLTALLRGRSINGTQNQGDVLKVQFTDGAVMTVKTAGSTNSASTGGVIKAVRQHDTILSLDFESGETLDILMAEATSSVMVRDKDSKLEYAD